MARRGLPRHGNCALVQILATCALKGMAIFCLPMKSRLGVAFPQLFYAWREDKRLVCGVSGGDGYDVWERLHIHQVKCNPVQELAKCVINTRSAPCKYTFFSSSSSSPSSTATTTTTTTSISTFLLLLILLLLLLLLLLLILLLLLFLLFFYCFFYYYYYSNSLFFVFFFFFFFFFFFYYYYLLLITVVVHTSAIFTRNSCALYALWYVVTSVSVSALAPSSRYNCFHVFNPFSRLRMQIYCYVSFSRFLLFPEHVC